MFRPTVGGGIRAEKAVAGPHLPFNPLISVQYTGQGQLCPKTLLSTEMARISY
jgi:hypothetical protein